MSRGRTLVLLALAVGLACGSVAAAASLTVTSQRLTSATTAVSVPKSVVSISQEASGGAASTAHTTTATLSGGTSSAVGALSFTLYPGGTCTGTPVAPGTQTINPINGANGQSYTSASRTPTTAGTYSWLASYGGDANNGSATNCKVISVGTVLRVSAITLVSRSLNTSNGKWSAIIKVEVRDGSGALVGGVVVTGAWSPDAQNAGQSGCTTDTSGGGVGTCNINSGSNSFPATATSETWTVSNLSKSGAVYDSASNVVSSIVVTKP